MLGGMLGFGRSTEAVIVFSVLGFVLAFSGGWVAASVDLWPTNIGKQRPWSACHLRNMPPEVDLFESYIAPDDEEDQE